MHAEASDSRQHSVGKPQRYRPSSYMPRALQYTIPRRRTHRIHGMTVQLVYFINIHNNMTALQTHGKASLNVTLWLIGALRLRFHFHIYYSLQGLSMQTLQEEVHIISSKACGKGSREICCITCCTKSKQWSIGITTPSTQCFVMLDKSMTLQNTIISINIQTLIAITQIFNLEPSTYFSSLTITKSLSVVLLYHVDLSATMTVMNIYLAVKTFVLMHRIHARRNDPLNKSSNCVTASKIVKILSPQGHSSVKLR